ncbi:MAG: amidohydrolase [Oscillatoriales cyanobacterium SM2_2_1]|nr:amidohydrolase [Oscillatoriales cyanobacterium SM2_2_1]
MTSIRPTLRALHPEVVTWRRAIHRYPELGFREIRTADYISSRLRQWGVPHQTGVAETGIVVTIPGAGFGPMLAIRADMDALPVQEENEVDYRSQVPGLMHACGHDGHTAIALGVTQYLWQRRDRLVGAVRIIFQPAEEGPGGAKPMIAAGVLEGVGAILGLHLWNNLPLGTVGVRSGAMMAAVEQFDCQIMGRGGHGAMPHQTVDALLVAAQVVTNMQAIVSRRVDPLDAVVVTVGKLHSGTARNVIADTAELAGTVRYFDPRYEGAIAQNIEAVIAGTCACHGARYRLDYQRFYPPVVNDAAIAQLVATVAESVVEPPLEVVPQCQTMGGEDMSYFLQQVPGCYFFVGAANRERGLDFPHHHPRFDFDEAALAMAMELFVRCVERYQGVALTD